ncbi:DUF6233 domain-containing protein [Streptomyces sp. NBC_00045]
MDVSGEPAWLPPDLDRLRTVETVLSVLLAKTRERIAVLEQAKRVRPDAARRQAPVVEWVIQYGISAQHRPELVHTGDCRMASGRSKPATRRQALETLQNTQARACEICRADSASDSWTSDQRHRRTDAITLPASGTSCAPGSRSWTSSTCRPSGRPSRAAAAVWVYLGAASARGCEPGGRGLSLEVAMRPVWSGAISFGLVTSL